VTEQTDIQRENRLAESVHHVALFAKLTICAIDAMPPEVRRSVFEAIIEVLQEQAKPYA